MKKRVLIFSLIIIAILCMPHNHDSVIKQISEIDKIITQVKIDDKNSMTLYLNNAGLLRCAITRDNILYSRLERISEGIETESIYEAESSNLRYRSNIMWYDEDKNYVIFGYIIDEDVSELVYEQEKLTEIVYDDMRIVYGIGKSDNKQCSNEVKAYNYQGEELDKRKNR